MKDIGPFWPCVLCCQARAQSVSDILMVQFKQIRELPLVLTIRPSVAEMSRDRGYLFGSFILRFLS